MEIRDLYDVHKNLTGKTFVKGEQVPVGYYYLIVAIVIENSKGEFLIQKRVPRKGGRWALTAGHPKSGENSFEGICSETLEELGIDISNDNPLLIDTWINNDQIFDIYYLKKDIDLADIVIQEEELSEVKWFSMDKLKEMVDKKELNDNQISCFTKVVDYLEKEGDKDE